MPAADDLDIEFDGLAPPDTHGDEVLAEELVRQITALERTVQTETAAIRREFEQTTETAQTEHNQARATSDGIYNNKTAQLRRLTSETRQRAEDVVAQTRAACAELRLRPPATPLAVPPGLDPHQELERLEQALSEARIVINDRRRRMGSIGGWWVLVPVALVYWIVLFWEMRQQYKTVSAFSGMAEALSQAWQAQVAAVVNRDQAAADERHQRELAEARERFDRDTRTARERQEALVTRLEQQTRSQVREIRSAVSDLCSRCENVEFFSAPWQRWQASGDDSVQALRLGTCLLPTPAIHSLLPGEEPFGVPVLIQFRGGKSLMIKQMGVRQEANALLQSLSIRLLATLPAGRVRFVALDPMGQGSNVGTLINLGDYQEDLVDKRAWSEPKQIEDALSGISSAMEEIIQKHLRDRHPTIESFNLQAEEVAQPYRILLVFDFPLGFNDVAARRLLSIMRNGPRCGVYCLVSVDEQAPVPYGFRVEELEQYAYVLTATAQTVEVPDAAEAELEAPEPGEDEAGVEIRLDEVQLGAAPPQEDDIDEEDDDFVITFDES